MELTLSLLAQKLGLTLAGEDAVFTGLNTLEAAGETEVSFLANPKYARFLDTTKACAVIVDAEHAPRVKRALISDNPYRDFAAAGTFFIRRQGLDCGISPLASVDPTARPAENVTVHPFAFVGARAGIGSGTRIFPGAYVGEDCVIGSNCTIYPNAVLMAGVEIGDNCTINAGAVLGTDGFGFAMMGGKMQKIPQIGTVSLAPGVDLGANACIDRATLGATSIGKDTKIDNLVQIGHNVTVGENCLLISQVGIAGSTKVGDRVTMAGQVGVAGHLDIGDDVVIGPQAGVPKDIPAGTTGSGTPFMEGRTFMRNAVLQPKLPELSRRVQELEKELARLKTLLPEE